MKSKFEVLIGKWNKGDIVKGTGPHLDGMNGFTGEITAAAHIHSAFGNRQVVRVADISNSEGLKIAGVLYLWADALEEA